MPNMIISSFLTDSFHVIWIFRWN